jgi:hypothetical protein
LAEQRVLDADDFAGDFGGDFGGEGFCGRADDGCGDWEAQFARRAYGRRRRLPN